MKKLFVVSDKNKKSENIKSKVQKQIQNSHFRNINMIIVIGGDGFMLQTLKEILQIQKTILWS